MGLWKHPDVPTELGNPETYKIAAEWLDVLPIVFDFGGGTGEAGKYFKHAQYVVVDGSESKAPIRIHVNDLAETRFTVPGILMRHVLEHNWPWSRILENAVNSFTKRMALVTFIEPKDSVHGADENLEWENPGYGNVPNLQINRTRLRNIITPYLSSEVIVQHVYTEHVYLLEKR